LPFTAFVEHGRWPEVVDILAGFSALLVDHRYVVHYCLSRKTAVAGTRALPNRRFPATAGTRH